MIARRAAIVKSRSGRVSAPAASPYAHMPAFFYLPPDILLIARTLTDMRL